MHLRCDGIFNDPFLAHSLLGMTVEDFYSRSTFDQDMHKSVVSPSLDSLCTLKNNMVTTVLYTAAYDTRKLLQAVPVLYVRLHCTDCVDSLC